MEINIIRWWNLVALFNLENLWIAPMFPQKPKNPITNINTTWSIKSVWEISFSCFWHNVFSICSHCFCVMLMFSVAQEHEKYNELSFNSILISEEHTSLYNCQSKISLVHLYRLFTFMSWLYVFANHAAHPFVMLQL